MGKECIKVMPTSRLAWISEELCIGCGICVKKCPFEAINIINIPRSCVHRTFLRTRLAPRSACQSIERSPPSPRDAPLRLTA